MDFDIEMDDAVPEVAPVPEVYTNDIVTGEEQEPGEVDDVPGAPPVDADTDQNAFVPYKIHVRGLDTFKPDDVEAYVKEHYGGEHFKIEWIDDTSANLVFKSDSSAKEALLALSSADYADITQLPPRESVPAKGFTSKPESVLHVRLAVNGDKKVKNASTYSRFYLMNPEFDPEERRMRGEFDRRRYRDRDGGHGNDRRRSNRKPRYDYDDEEKSFDVNLYDDDADTLAKRTDRASRPRRDRSDSVSTRSSEPDRLRNQTRRNKDKELFPDRRPNRETDLLPDRAPRDRYARDRSASPLRDRDERDNVDLDENSRNMTALRNREKARAIRERQSRENREKDMFPEKTNGTKELFPSRIGSTAPQGKAQMDRVDDSTSTILSSAKLADRITPRDTSAFNIRGLANKRGTDQGFAIKGIARELFPGKFSNSGNAGKELFSDKLEGRGRRRNRAEDLFL